MPHPTHRDSLLVLALSLALSIPALADDPPQTADAPPAAASAAPADASTAPPAISHTADWEQVLQLGKIRVEGDSDQNSRRIVAGLKIIKAALRTNLSNDPADADKVVCRMNYDTGSHLNAHLMCATNRSMRMFKEGLHAAQLVHTYGIPDGGAEQLLENMNGSVQKDRYFSTKVRAAELQKMLLEVQCNGCSDSGLVVGNN